jgi:hypothetical protein
MTTIDKLASDGGIQSPDHLKVDVEGLGLEVLKGAAKTIEDARPVIYIEPHEVEDNNDRSKELHRFFELHGYTVKKMKYPWVCSPI